MPYPRIARMGRFINSRKNESFQTRFLTYLHPILGCGNLPLVEATGVEPVSENPLTQPSSWVVYLLEFPLTNADRQAFDQGSPFVHDRVKGESPMHVHH